MSNRYGMKIIGYANGTGSVGAFRFNTAQVPSNLEKPVVFRFRGGVERTGENDASKPWSVLALTVINRQTNASSAPIEFHPESSRDSSVLVPAQYVQGGHFDLQVRGMHDGQGIVLTKI